MQNKDVKVGIIWDLLQKREVFKLNYILHITYILTFFQLCCINLFIGIMVLNDLKTVVIMNKKPLTFQQSGYVDVFCL